MALTRYRLWILSKSGLYSGGQSSVAQYDPAELTNSDPAPLMPAQILSAASGDPGMFLISYSAATTFPNEFLRIIHIANPLSSPTFTLHWVELGEIDDNVAEGIPPWWLHAKLIPDAPQPGGAHPIDTGDRRVYSAVWRDNHLYAASHVLPAAGPDQGQTTVHWWHLFTSAGGTPVLVEQGNLGGEELGVGTSTYYPAIDVDVDGNLGIGFSASGPGVYGGAYFAMKLLADPLGSFRPSEVVAEGQDVYVNLDDEGDNRWGDYSGLAVDPTDGTTFWAFNMYAVHRGLQTGIYALQWKSFKHVPQVKSVPGDYANLQTAIIGTEAGNVVEVDGSVFTATNPIPAVTMKSGVTVRMKPGEARPVINAQGTSVAVTFPGNSRPSTKISGFEIRGFTQSGIRQAEAGAGSGSWVAIEDCHVVGGQYGIWGYRGVLSVRGCEVLGQSLQGVVIEDSPDCVLCDATVVESSLIAGSGGDGIVILPGIRQIIIENNTIAGWSNGVRFNGGAYFPPVEMAKNIIVDNGMGVDCDYMEMLLSCNDVFENGTALWHCGSAETENNVSVDPLFCGARESSVEEYTLRVDSPCAADMAPCGLVGAKPAECAWGTLARNTTVGDVTVQVLEDVTVPSGKSLTLDAGALLRFDDDDNGASGSDTTLNELIINGVLEVNGSPSSTVKFQSANSEPAEGDWYGIEVQTGGTASIDYAEIKHAINGVSLQGSSDASVTSSGFSANEVSDVVLHQGTLHGCTIGAGSSGSGVEVVSTGPGNMSYISDCTIGGGLRGIRVANGGRVQVGGTMVQGATQGIRVLSGGLLFIEDSDVLGATTGINFVGGDGRVGRGNAVCTLGGPGTIAVNAFSGATVEILAATIQGAETGVLASGNGTTVNIRGGTVIDGCDWGLWADTGAILSANRDDCFPSCEEFPLVTIRNASVNGMGLWSSQPTSLLGVKVEASTTADWVGIEIGPGASATLEGPQVLNLTGGNTGSNAVGILVEGEAQLLAPRVHRMYGTKCSGVFVDVDSTVAVSIDSTTTIPWVHAEIDTCYYGVRVDGTARKEKVLVRGAKVDSCYVCVNIGLAAVPDFGDSVSSYGHNVIRRATSKLAGGKVRLGEIDDVPARGNYWGSNPPDASKISAWVDYSGYLSAPPYGMQRVLASMGIIEEPPPPSFFSPAYPSPFAGSLTIPLFVATSAAEVKVEVFDLLGRFVRTLQDGSLGQGRHALVWDGRTGGGRRAASGVYFVRATVADQTATQRIVLAD